MSRLTVLPGGNGVPDQVRPAVRITARRQAANAGHPVVALYDRTAEPDPAVLVLTDAAWHALNIVGHYVRVPGAVPREVALAQVDVLADWSRSQPARTIDTDDQCNPFGMPRPGGAS